MLIVHRETAQLSEWAHCHLVSHCYTNSCFSVLGAKTLKKIFLTAKKNVILSLTLCVKLQFFFFFALNRKEHEQTLTIRTEQLHVTLDSCELERREHFHTLRIAFTDKQLHLNRCAWLQPTEIQLYNQTPLRARSEIHTFESNPLLYNLMSWCNWAPDNCNWANCSFLYFRYAVYTNRHSVPNGLQYP